MDKSKKEIITDAVSAFVTTFAIASGIITAVAPIAAAGATHNWKWILLYILYCPAAVAALWAVATD